MNNSKAKFFKRNYFLIIPSVLALFFAFGFSIEKTEAACTQTYYNCIEVYNVFNSTFCTSMMQMDGTNCTDPSSGTCVYDVGCNALCSQCGGYWCNMAGTSGGWWNYWCAARRITNTTTNPGICPVDTLHSYEYAYDKAITPCCGNGNCESGENYSNCPGDCPCTDTTWSPDPSTQCGPFTQTSNCGNNRPATGTNCTPSGNITAPNCNISTKGTTCSTNVSWSTQNVASAYVNKRNVGLFANGQSGTQATTVDANGSWFDLYQGGTNALLGSAFTQAVCSNPTYSDPSCSPASVPDCDSNCGKSILNTPICTAISSCTGERVSTALGVCGSTCTASTTICPPCNTNYKEVAP